MRHLALVALLASISLASAAVTLTLTDNMKLPSDYGGDPKVVTGDKTYTYDRNVGEKNAIMDNFVFVVGETGFLHVIDTTKHASASSQIVDMYDLGAPATDVSACVAPIQATYSVGLNSVVQERLLAVSTINTDGSKQSPGRVLLFTVNDDIKPRVLTFKREFSTVGSLPDQIKWTKDCRAIIAAIEGEAALTTNPAPNQPSLNNPLGGIAVLRFRENDNIADDTSAAFTFYDFESYVAAKSQEMLNDGVRWCMRPDTKGVWDKNDAGALIADDQATFARDLEPEYLALASDGRTVYVSLQENSAIATFDLSSNSFTQVKALEPKDWSKTNKGLDASNQDDKINMQKWNVFGMLMPDTIDIFKASDGVEYIVIANEGDDKEYVLEVDGQETVWTEMIRGKDMADAGMSVKSGAGVTDAELADTAMLGRIKSGWFDGRGSNFGDKKFEKIYTMGGRSFSIISTETWKTVYDSGSLMEEILEAYYSNIFNSEAEDGGAKPQTDNMDARSDDKGLETESLTIASVCGKTYLFVGGERTSTIFVFDITDPKKPSLESHTSAAGDVTKKPIDVFNSLGEKHDTKNELGQIDPEMMSYDEKRHLLIVSGAVSGTLGIYKVEGLPTCGGSCGPCEEDPAPKIDAASSDSEHFVNFTATLPYLMPEFDELKHTAYKAAVALAAEAPVGNVHVIAVSARSRRAAHMAPRIDVLTKIVAADASGMRAISSALGSGDDFKAKLNGALDAKGLKRATDVTNPVKAYYPDDHDHDDKESSAHLLAPVGYVMLMAVTSAAFGFW